METGVETLGKASDKLDRDFEHLLTCCTEQVLHGGQRQTGSRNHSLAVTLASSRWKNRKLLFSSAQELFFGRYGVHITTAVKKELFSYCTVYSVHSVQPRIDLHLRSSYSLRQKCVKSFLQKVLGSLKLCSDNEDFQIFSDFKRTKTGLTSFLQAW
jgi:hypothetical protein